MTFHEYSWTTIIKLSTKRNAHVQSLWSGRLLKGSQGHSRTTCKTSRKFHLTRTMTGHRSSIESSNCSLNNKHVNTSVTETHVTLALMSSANVLTLLKNSPTATAALRPLSSNTADAILATDTSRQHQLHTHTPVSYTHLTLPTIYSV